MRLFTPSIALLGCLLMAGCSSAPSNTATAGQEAAGAVVAPAASSGDKVKAGLDAAGRDLIGRAGRTVVPNKKKPKTFKSGKEYVAQYIVVDPATMTTIVRPGATANTHVGVIQYQEVTMECRGATKAKAVASNACTQVKRRNVKELIQYDGKKWQY